MPDFVLPVSTKWDVNIGQISVDPIIAGGVVYVVANSSTNINMTPSSLYALNAKNGAVIWGPKSLSFSPGPIAFDNGKLFVTGSGTNNSTLMACFNASDGSVAWSTTISSSYNYGYSPFGSPAPYNGNIYVQEAGGVYCVRESDGNTLWSRMLNQSPQGEVAATANGVFAYVGCGSAYNLDPATGTIIWSQPVGCNGNYQNFVAYSNGDVFIPNFTSGSNPSGPAVLNATNGGLVSLLPQAGLPAIDSTVMVSVNTNHAVLGTKLSDWSNAWTANNGIDLPVTPPTIVNGIAYVLTSTGLLNGYNDTSGALAISVPLGETPASSPYFNSSLPDLAAGDGIIVAPVGSHLVAVGTPFATVTAAPNPATPNGTNGWYKSAVTVTLTSTAGTPYYTVDGGATQTYSAPVTISTSGLHSLVYWAADTSGDVTAKKALALNLDVAAPITTAALTGTKLVTGDFAQSATVALSASDNLSGVASTSYSVDGAASQTYSVPFIVSGKGTHKVVFYSTDKAGNVESNETININIQSPLMTTFASGLQMISAPADFSGQPLTSIFDEPLKLATWNPSAFSYALSPTAPADTMHVGVGYWARVPATGVDLLDVGVHTDTTQSFTISLAAGWNLIGDPFPYPMALQSLEAVSAQGTIYAVGSTGSIVAQYLYTYPAGATAYTGISGSGQVVPFAGYWIYAYQPCKLIFPGTPAPPGNPTGFVRKH
jgi:hypothetical protein